MQTVRSMILFTLFIVLHKPENKVSQMYKSSGHCEGYTVSTLTLSAKSKGVYPPTHTHTQTQISTAVCITLAAHSACLARWRTNHRNSMQLEPKLVLPVWTQCRALSSVFHCTELSDCCLLTPSGFLSLGPFVDVSITTHPIFCHFVAHCTQTSEPQKNSRIIQQTRGGSYEIDMYVVRCLAVKKDYLRLMVLI